MKRLSAATYAQLYYTSAVAVPARQRSVLAGKFIQLLRRHRALKLWPRIKTHLQRLDDATHGVTRVAVTAAKESDVVELEGQLQKILGPVVLDLTTNPEVGFGLVLRVGDQQIDGTIRTRLDRLHHHLISS